MTKPIAVLQIFSREPVPGKTKTRLIPSIGIQRSAELHKNLLVRTITTSRKSKFRHIELWGTSEPDHTMLNKYAKENGLQLYIQCGEDVGGRMYHSSKKALEEYEFVVMIGCDCPVLTSQVLNQAYNLLDQGNDAVLGPAEDGGYYLLGLRQTDISLFKDIQWGGSEVTGQTRSKLEMLSWHWEELEYLWDVDRPEDVTRLSQNQELMELTPT